MDSLRPHVHGRDIIVVGASAGGIEALQSLLGTLRADLPATLFVVIHLHPTSPGMLPDILQKASKLPIQTAVDGATIERGRVFVAPPDRHLLVEAGCVRVVRGPKENGHRPAVDPLFRSAAHVYGARVVGVVLSGMLNDGSAGLWAVKSSGGIAVVQDPDEARYASMPLSALMRMEVDHCLPLERIGELLTELSRTASPTKGRAAGVEKVDAQAGFGLEEHTSGEEAMGELSAFTCPNCGGALWEIEDGDLLRYRCHTGHGFSADSLVTEQSEAVEEALYSALRALKERAALSRRLVDRYGERLPELSERYEDEARQFEEQSETLRRLLFGENVPTE